MKKEPNYFHKKLEELGQKVIKDEIIGFSHFYYFDCGCNRVYSVSPLTLTQREDLYPCEEHKHLMET